MEHKYSTYVLFALLLFGGVVMFVQGIDGFGTKGVIPRFENPDLIVNSSLVDDLNGTILKFSTVCTSTNGLCNGTLGNGTTIINNTIIYNNTFNQTFNTTINTSIYLNNISNNSFSCNGTDKLVNVSIDSNALLSGMCQADSVQTYGAQQPWLYLVGSTFNFNTSMLPIYNDTRWSLNTSDIINESGLLGLNYSTLDVRYLTGLLRLYFYNISDPIFSNYTIMNTSIPDLNIVMSDSFTLTSPESTLASRIYTGNISSIPPTAYLQHTSINFTNFAGAKSVRLHSEIYRRNSTGFEFLIGSSIGSDVLISGYQDVDWTGVISNDTIFNHGDYLVMRLNASVSGAGNNPQIVLVVGDRTGASLEIGANRVDTSFIEVDPVAIPKIDSNSTIFMAYITGLLNSNTSLWGALNSINASLISEINLQNLNNQSQAGLINALSTALSNTNNSVNLNSTIFVNRDAGLNSSIALNSTIFVTRDAGLNASIQQNSTYDVNYNLELNRSKTGNGTAYSSPLINVTKLIVQTWTCWNFNCSINTTVNSTGSRIYYNKERNITEID